MQALIEPYARDEIILARDKDDICQHLQEFLVAEYDGHLAGLVALHVYEPKLAEVRSLVVDASLQKHGIGRLLVEAAEKWASDLGIARIFALTYVTGFFERLGYAVVSKESLPHKIWTVCVHCSRFSHCDEVAVLKHLAGEAHVTPILEVEQP